MGRGGSPEELRPLASRIDDAMSHRRRVCQQHGGCCELRLVLLLAKGGVKLQSDALESSDQVDHRTQR